MKDFRDYVNQDKSTDDTSLNRMRLSRFFFFFFSPPSEKGKVVQFKHSGHEKTTPPLACEIRSNKPISNCFC